MLSQENGQTRLRSCLASLASVPFLLGLIAGCAEEVSEPGEETASEPKRIELAYVTNGIDPFWNIAAAGVRAAAADFDVDCEILMPPKGLVDQQRMIEAQIANGVQGIAVSPIDAENQVGFLNDIARTTNLITQDSDAPKSDRICFVGMNNYTAGRQAGTLVKEAMPEGGSVMIFVGRLEQLNAQQRRQGLIDELLDRPEQTLEDLKIDPQGAEIEGEKYTILGTRTDNFDYPKAKSNAEDTIAAFDDLGCMVGLFAYNPPMCLEAIKNAGKIGEIKVVGFDEQDATLQGIIDGTVYGTISQQPYKYGYESVRILTGLAKGDKSVLPEGGYLEISSIVVRKDNVETFWAELKELQSE